MLNRRTFIHSTLAFSVLGPSIASSAPQASHTAEPWTAEYFEDRLGQRFQLSGSAEGVASLTSVERCTTDAHTESFHVRFEVECDNPIEGIYQLNRPLAGCTHLFLQPRGQLGNRQVMEASIARLLS